MRKLIFLAGLAVVLTATAAQAQTPAPTVAATASPDGSQRRDAQAPAVGGFVFSQPNIHEGGAQIGTTANGASLLTFVKRGSCVVNPNQLGAADVQDITCAATGAVAGDAVFAAIATVSDVKAATIVRAAAGTDSVTFKLMGMTAAQDMGAVTINFLVVR